MIQKKIMAAQQKVSALSQSLKDATKPNSSESLFGEDEITEEVWTPLMARRVMPDNAIPAKYSKVQKAFEGSSKLYMAKLDEMAAGSNDDIIDMLGNSKDFIKAGGDLAVAIEGLIPGSPKVAATITKGVTVAALAAGTGIAKAALQKNCDDAVTNLSLLIKDVVANAVGGDAGAKLGAAVAAGFSRLVQRGPDGQGPGQEAPSRSRHGPRPHRQAAIVNGMHAADTNATDGGWGMAGEAISGAPGLPKKSTTNTIQKAIESGQRSPTARCSSPPSPKGAAAAFGTYLTIDNEFVSKEIEEKQKEKEKEKEEADKKKEEAERGKDEAERGKDEAVERRPGPPPRGREAAQRRLEEARSRLPRRPPRRRVVAEEEARKLHDKAESLDGDKKVEATPARRGGRRECSRGQGAGDGGQGPVPRRPPGPPARPTANLKEAEAAREEGDAQAGRGQGRS